MNRTIHTLSTSRTALILLLATLLTATTAQTTWAWSGSGNSENDPILITNASDLTQLATNVNNGTNYENVYFKQTANITLTSAWTPIGTQSHPFKGHYDGGNFTISGLTVSGSYQYAGLFGYITSDYDGPSGHFRAAVLKNINIVDCNIDVSSAGSGNGKAGGIAGYVTCFNMSNCKVSGTIKGYDYAAGLIGEAGSFCTMSGCFADVTVNAHKADPNAQYPPAYCLIGQYSNNMSASDNYYHNTAGVPVGISTATPLYTVSAPGATVSGTSTVSHDGTGYYAEGAVLTIGTGSTDKVFSDFTATGATASSLAADRRSATVTVGTADVTVSASLLTIAGTCGSGVTWSLTQDNSDNYTRLTVGGNGAMQDYGYTTVGGLWRTTAPWGYDLTSVTVGDGVTAIGSYAFIGCQSLATATIGSSVATIGQQAFDHCDALVTVTLPASVTTLGQGAFYNCTGLQRIDILHDGDVSLAADVFYNDNALQYITFPSPAALQANTTGNWSAHAAKLRVTLGSQLFTATTEGGTPAYKIATADDLRNLAAAVNATANISTGKTFRQTADIDLASGGNFTPIGENGADESFAGTYDGGGYTISGLTVSIDYGDIGLFGVVKGATVSNVILLRPTVTATTTSNYSVSLGALIGTCNSGSSNLVENCHVVNPTVSSSSTGSNDVGAIIGNIFSKYTTVTNCYYYGGNANAAYGINPNGATVTNVCAAHLVTPADGVTIQTPMAADLGFTCDADNNGTPENYWRTGAQLTLGYTGTVADGYTIGYTATNGGTISGSTLTMPDADLAVAMSPQTIPWSGSGSASDPYVIEYPSQLLLLAHRVNGTSGETAVEDGYSGMYFKLGADITFDHAAVEGDDYAENYEAIGGVFGGYSYYFFGDFDGDGHTVSGIRIRKDGTGINYGYVGLFGYLDEGSNVHDVHLTDARIKGDKNVGGIAGYTSEGIVTGCIVTNSYITASDEYGTICGENDGTLRNNYYHGCTVNGTAATSGVGCREADITANHGALPAYAITFGDGVSTTALASAPENGFVYNGVSYYREGLALPLASEAPEGYTLSFSANGTALSGNTYTVNATDGDVTINTTLRSDGQQHEVSYMTADGTTQTAKAIALDGHETVDEYGEVHLAAGTYYVGTDIAYANQIWPDGDVTFILANGKTMTLNGNTEGIVGNNLTITIYGQSLDDATAGTLRYNGKSDGIHAYYYEQHSGNVSITTSGSGVNGIIAYVTLLGGTLTISANGDNAVAIDGTTHSILGGQLTATGTGAGIRASADDGTALTLGWNRPADRITASSISAPGGGTVAVATGQALTDGSGNIYTGTLTDEQKEAIAGKTLQPWLVLNETNGVTPLTTLAGQTNVPVIFTRTFTSGVASTICLPFAISADQATAAGNFYTFAGVDTSGSDWVVIMQEANATNAALAANTPYLFMPSADSEVTFSGTIGTIANTYTAGTTTSDEWTYKGTYETIEWESDPGTIYGFASGQAYGDSGDQTEAGKFIRVHTGGIRPFRAYLEYAPSAARALSRSANDGLPETMTVRLIGSNGQTTAIGTLDTRTGDVTFGDEWYTLDGRRLPAKPTAKGLYINKGNKVFIK